MLEALAERIEAREEALGVGLGWRLLYSPATTVEHARIAFIGLNPGGRAEDPRHAQLAPPRGSAYRDEAWGRHPAGRAPLQVQVQRMCALLDEPAERVLAGNLVPYRSPRWTDLPDRKGAVAFGQSLWSEILTRAAPELIITMGAEATTAVSAVFGNPERTKLPVSWGSVSGHHAAAGGVRLVGLPHLSTFRIFGRPASAAALERLFFE
ncbi:hypothetical protein [Litorisediminicola beolgyonensis]|uniref:Uracil DNA glycosylase superfamily protein n=1 Tax=Litorisediminicola beolgyonensis TaxID=1173614 RepID=A0ABW3ZIG0_9RHOB